MNKTTDALIVDAMLGICVHNPDHLLLPPSNIRSTAANALHDELNNASLAPDAKTAFIITQGGRSFESLEQQATRDLPEQLRLFMVKNGLDPSRYETRFFSESLRSDVKVLWAVAVQKKSEAPVAQPAAEAARPTSAAGSPITVPRQANRSLVQRIADAIRKGPSSTVPRQAKGAGGVRRWLVNVAVFVGGLLLLGVLLSVIIFLGITYPQAGTPVGCVGLILLVVGIVAFTQLVRKTQAGEPVFAPKARPITEQQVPQPDNVPPATGSEAKTQPALDQVTFLREERQVPAPGVTRIYRVHRAPDMRTAKAFLAQNPVTRMHQYLIVETPQGNVGRDISGAFVEATGQELSLADTGATTGTLIWYAPPGIVRGMWLGQTATAHALDASGARTEAHQARFAPCDERGEIIAAVFAQLPAGRYELAGGTAAGARQVVVHPGSVTEVDKAG